MHFQCSPSLTKEAEDNANDGEDPSSDQSCLSVVVLIVPQDVTLMSHLHCIVHIERKVVGQVGQSQKKLASWVAEKVMDLICNLCLIDVDRIFHTLYHLVLSSLTGYNSNHSTQQGQKKNLQTP